MREAVRVIASFNTTGGVIPLYMKLEKGEREVTLKIEEYYIQENSFGQDVFSREFRCISTYANRKYEYTLNFQKSSLTWYMTASNSTIDGLFKNVPKKKADTKIAAKKEELPYE